MMKEALVEAEPVQEEENPEIQALQHQIRLLQDERRATILREEILRKRSTEKELMAETLQTSLNKATAELTDLKQQLASSPGPATTTSPPSALSPALPTFHASTAPSTPRSRSNSLPLSDTAPLTRPRSRAWGVLESQLGEMRGVRRRVVELTGDNESLTRQLGSVREELEAARGDLSAARRKVMELQEAGAGKEESVTPPAASGQVSGELGDVGGYRRALEVQKAAFDEMAAEYSRQLTAAEEEVADARLQVQQTTRDRARLDDDRRDVSSKVEALEIALAAEQATARQAKDDLAAAVTRIDRMTEQMFALAGGEQDLIDGGVAASLFTQLVTHFDNESQRRQIIALASNLITFSDRDLVALGLKAEDRTDRMTLGEMWVEFLKGETEDDRVHVGD